MAARSEVWIRLADELPHVEVDASIVELCLVNLISNAIKYPDRAGKERWIAVGGRNEPGLEDGPAAHQGA